MFCFIPVVTSKPTLPYFLISSFFCAISSSTAVIWSRISRARRRQYSSLFWRPSPSGSSGREGRAPFFGGLPTTDTPEPFREERSSSVYTLPFAVADFFSLALRAASARESSFWGGCAGAAG